MDEADTSRPLQKALDEALLAVLNDRSRTAHDSALSALATIAQSEDSLETILARRRQDPAWRSFFADPLYPPLESAWLSAKKSEEQNTSRWPGMLPDDLSPSDQRLRFAGLERYWAAEKTWNLGLADLLQKHGHVHVPPPVNVCASSRAQALQSREDAPHADLAALPGEHGESNVPLRTTDPVSSSASEHVVPANEAIEVSADDEKVQDSMRPLRKPAHPIGPVSRAKWAEWLVLDVRTLAAR